MENKKFKPYLPSDCMDIVRSLFMVRGDELRKLFKEEVSIKKAWACQEVKDSKNGLTYHDEIRADLLGRESGKKWLMIINLEDKSCEVRNIKEASKEEVNENQKGTNKEEKAVSQSRTRKRGIAKA